MVGRIPPVAYLVVGTILGVFGIIAGTYDPLWEWAGITGVQLRGYLTLCASLVILLIGYLLAYYAKLEDIEKSLNVSWREVTAGIQAGLPRIQSIRALSADMALQEVATKLPQAHIALNTRIVSDAVETRYKSKEGQQYEAAVKESIKSGTIFREVVSAKWADYCRALSAKNADRQYECRLADNTLPSFLNFIVLEYKSSEREVYFGWAISPARGFDQVCFQSSEERLVSFFRDWHLELMAASELIK